MYVYVDMNIVSYVSCVLNANDLFHVRTAYSFIRSPDIQRDPSHELKKSAKINILEFEIKAQNATHLLKLINKICKYEMDQSIIAEDADAESTRLDVGLYMTLTSKSVVWPVHTLDSLLVY